MNLLLRLIISKSVLQSVLFNLMASTSKIIEAMNNVTLEDEEDEGLSFDMSGEETILDNCADYNAELCLVGRFLVEELLISLQ